MMLHELNCVFSSYSEGVKRIKANGYILAFDKDILIPMNESQQLAETLRGNGNSITFETHPSIFGHDAFLKEISFLTERLKNFLNTE